ncbi:restriction endonuclease subunit S [Planktothrix agardhii]|uniref:restriction endonuclease subunit S n=1 Tax=Planktothrix agardhii TaxID=1160 RepID=UPI00241FA03D|nr:restriction endonuclease subunit S [Planktothrix agardhii]
MSEEDYEKYFKKESKALTKPQVNDILFSIIGTLGERYIYKEQDYFGISSSVSILRPFLNKVYPLFLFYWIKSNTFQKALYGIKGGVAQGYVSLDMIRALPIHYPDDIAIQHKIADILSKYDDLIENNRRRIELLEESARLLYREWFVYLRFPGHEHTPNIDGIPEGWEKTILEKVGFLNYGKALKKDERVLGKYPVFGSGGIIGTHNKFLVEAPGIIVGRKGSIGNVFWTKENYYPIDTTYYINKEQSNLYLYYALQNIGFINTDVAVPGLNRDFAHSRNLLMPDKKLLVLFDDFVNPVYKQISKLNKYDQKLQQARDILIPRLMNGEIAV